MIGRSGRTHPALGFAIVLAAMLWHRGGLAADLKVCVDRASAGQALDRKLVDAVARQEGVTPTVVTFDGGSDDDDDGLPAKTFRQLVTSSCQLLLGYPVDVDKPMLPEGVKATQPYARTGFVLVTRKATYTSLEALPDKSLVAVTYLTAPNLVFERRAGLVPQVFNTDTDSLHALLHRKVDAAMLWRPFLEHALLSGPRVHLTISPLHERHAAFNLVALYGEGGDAEASRFNQAIAALEQAGQMDALVRPYADAVPADTAPPAATSERRPVAGGRGQYARAGWRLVPVASKKHAHKDSGPPPALYTDDQATKGQALFASDCAACHGPNLEGRAGPALKGPTFATPAANFSVSDIFHIVSQNMPASAPGTLAHDDYTQIMAFLLRENGYPAGSTPLTFDGANVSKAKFVDRTGGAK